MDCADDDVMVAALVVAVQFAAEADRGADEDGVASTARAVGIRRREGEIHRAGIRERAAAATTSDGRLVGLLTPRRRTGSQQARRLARTQSTKAKRPRSIRLEPGKPERVRCRPLVNPDSSHRADRRTREMAGNGRSVRFGALHASSKEKHQWPLCRAFEADARTRTGTPSLRVNYRHLALRAACWRETA
jgi:hypothetical protein